MSKSNVPALRADCEAFLKGSEAADGGRVALALDLVEYHFTPIVYGYEESGLEVKDDFVITDLVLNKPKNAKGEFHKTLQGHRRDAVCVNLFGFPSYNIPPKLNTSLDKLVPESIAVRHYYMREDNTLSIRMVKVPGAYAKSSKRVIGNIPAGDMFALVDDKGEATALARRGMKEGAKRFWDKHKREYDNERELLDFLLTYPVEADGRKNSVFDAATLTSVQFLERLRQRAVDDGVIPAPPKRDTERKDKGASFAEQAVAVLKVLDEVLATDESPVAFTDELTGVMNNIAERWAALRAAFLI